MERVSSAKIRTDINHEKEYIAFEVGGSYGADAPLLHLNIVDENIKNHIQNVITDNDGKWPLKVTYTDSGRSYYVNDNGIITEVEKTKTNITLPKEDIIGKYVNYVPINNSYSRDKLAYQYTGMETSNQYFGNKNDLETTNYLGGWRIFDFDEEKGILYLVSEVSTEKLGMGGINAYSNGVNILNDICETLYSNSSLNARARSINYSDIENKITDIARARRGKYYNWENDYLEASTLGDIRNNFKVPKMYLYELENNLDNSSNNPNGIVAYPSVESAYETLSQIEGKQSFWWVNFKDENDFIDNYKENIDLFYSNKIQSYWIATRSTSIAKDETREYIAFFIGRMLRKTIWRNELLGYW